MVTPTGSTIPAVVPQCPVDYITQDHELDGSPQVPSFLQLFHPCPVKHIVLLFQVETGSEGDYIPEDYELDGSPTGSTIPAVSPSCPAKHIVLLFQVETGSEGDPRGP